MKKMFKYALYVPILIGLLMFSACEDDDDDPVPVDPVVTLNETSGDTFSGGTITIAGTVLAPGGFATLTADGNDVSAGLTTGATGEQSFSFDVTVPATATIGSTVEIDIVATDALQQQSMEVSFTINIVDTSTPTVAFTDFENGIDTVFNADSQNAISLTVSKDPLVGWSELRSAKSVNGDSQTPESIDISNETGSTITYTLSVDEEFLDEVTLNIVLIDELGNETERIDFSYDVLSSTGATFLIDEVDVNGNTVQRVRGNITEDATLMASNDYWLSGGVEVSDGATLTVMAGTTVYAEPGEGTQLEVDDSGMLMANGTAVDPIIFTSGASLEGDTPEPGDWAGIRMEGGEGINSGTLRYARVEYGGDGDAGLRLNDIDEATTIEFIQVYRGSADEPGAEIRGGNVHISNLYISECENTSLNFRSSDTEFTGSLQYVIIQSSDFPEKDDQDFTAQDDSEFVISNLTMIGAGGAATPEELSAIRMRSSVNYSFYNSLIGEYSNDGLRVDDPTDISTPVDIDGGHVFAHSFIFQIGDDPTRDDSDPDNLPLPFETDAGSYFNTIDANNTPAAAAGIGVNDFVPNASITSAFDPTTLGGSFGAGTYVGAIGTTDWTLGWTLNADGSPR